MHMFGSAAGCLAPRQGVMGLRAPHSSKPSRYLGDYMNTQKGKKVSKGVKYYDHVKNGWPERVLNWQDICIYM